MQIDEIRGSRAAVVWPRGRLVLGGMLASALCLLALAARCGWLGRPALVFMSWNLLLAWMPLLFNVLASAETHRTWSPTSYT